MAGLALLLGKFVEMSHDIFDADDPDLKGNDTYLQFFRINSKLSRDPTIRAKVQKMLLSMGRRLEFHISCYNIDPESATADIFSYAITSAYTPMDNIKFCISLEIIEKLLAKNITPAEKMVGRFLLACTLLHELAVCPSNFSRLLTKELLIVIQHAIWFDIKLYHNVPPFSEQELYFEDEVMAEIWVESMTEAWVNTDVK